MPNSRDPIPDPQPPQPPTDLPQKPLPEMADDDMASWNDDEIIVCFCILDLR